MLFMILRRDKTLKNATHRLGGFTSSAAEADAAVEKEQFVMLVSSGEIARMAEVESEKVLVQDPLVVCQGK